MDRRPTRRQLLGSVLGAALLAACDDAPAADTTSTTAGPATTTTTTGTTLPPRGGTLRIGLVGTPPANLDPLKWAEPDIQRVYRPAIESLYEFEADGSLRPVLAAGPVDVSRDRLVYTVELGRDVAFHDGSTFDATAVTASFQAAGEPANASQWLPRLSVAGAEVRAAGAHTVVFTLPRPFAPFETMLARIPILPAVPEYRAQETYAASLVGTGPFRLVTWERDGSARFEAFADHHGGRPDLDRIELVPFASDAERVEAMVAGEVAVAPIDPTIADRYRQAGMAVRPAETSVIRHVLLTNSASNRPTSSLAFRRAVSAALDRATMVDRVLGGIGQPLTAMLAESTRGWSAVPGRAEPGAEAAAATLVAEAGGAPAEPLVIIVAQAAVPTGLADRVAADLAAVGLGSVVEPLDPASFARRLAIGDPASPGDFDLALVSSFVQPSSGFGPDYAYFSQRSGLFTNLNKVVDEELDRLLDAAVAAPNPAAATDAWAGVMTYDLERGLHQIPLVVGRYLEAVAAATLSGYTVPATGTHEATARGVTVSA